MVNPLTPCIWKVPYQVIFTIRGNILSNNFTVGLTLLFIEECPKQGSILPKILLLILEFRLA